jgi:hypothetical protein
MNAYDSRHHDIWGMGVNEHTIQVTIGSGDRGFTHMSRTDAKQLMNQLKHPTYQYVLGGVQLTPRQMLRLRDVIQEVLASKRE